MVLYPEVQAKAKAEIDTIVGNGRLPCMEDRESLPYLNAIVLELYRWHIVLPTGESTSTRIPSRSDSRFVFSSIYFDLRFVSFLPIP
jgi:hypothetical protein